MTDRSSESSIEAKPCIICQREGSAEPTMTTNRSIDQVNHRITIEPVCVEHEVYSEAERTSKVVDAGNARLLAECIRADIIEQWRAEQAARNFDAQKHDRQLFEQLQERLEDDR